MITFSKKLNLYSAFTGTRDTEECYICDNGECVDKYARCNGIYDCIDGEDEIDCGMIG